MKRRKSRTNVNGSSRRQKDKSVESIDRISILPDSILGIVLSSLPTKNAVSTAVLSKRWKLVWTTVHNLDLCYEDKPVRQDERDDMRFAEFVNRVLLLHDVGRLNKFRLVWTPRCISSHAISWINTVISKNVHELTLHLETQTFLESGSHVVRHHSEPFVVPICVFSCNTLRLLELSGGISISLSTAVAVCLPGLETLSLSSVCFQSEEAFEKFIKGCPVLINLIIIWPDDMVNEFQQDDGFRYIISSTSLRRLELWIELYSDYLWYINLELEASSLEYLRLDGYVLPIFHVRKSLTSLVEAKYEISFGSDVCSEDDLCNLFVEAVRVLHCAKALSFSAEIIWALSFATISLSTEFKRLEKLEAEAYCCACSSLRDFIECSDNLQVLTMNQLPEVLEEDEDRDHDHTSWTTPVQVPRCLSNNLKKVVFSDYYHREDEREMIRYMLKHGSALEDVEISSYRGDYKKSELVKEICEFSRKLSSKFPACEVKFAGETSKCNVRLL